MNKLNKKSVEQLANAVTALRANGFTTLSEAAVFCVVATSTVNGNPGGVVDVAKVTEQPISTVSRVLWDLSQRGLLYYESHPKDRRQKVLKANLEAFKP